MPAKYKQLIVGLVTFLGLMLLVGHFRIDTSGKPPVPPEVRAQQARLQARDAELAEQRRNPYRYQHARYPGCTGPQAAPDLALLRQWRSGIDSGITFADAADPHSLQPLDDIARQLDTFTPVDCLQAGKGALRQAIFRAKGVLLARRHDTVNVFELREEMRAGMQHYLDTADREFALVEETLQQAGPQ